MVKGIQKYNMYDFSALINTLVECNINEIENSRTVYLCTSSIVQYMLVIIKTILRKIRVKTENVKY